MLMGLSILCCECEKGGGPYGAEVTRGQDLTGKDFSGKTLIKQDFKTVLDFFRNTSLVISTTYFDLRNAFVLLACYLIS